MKITIFFCVLFVMMIGTFGFKLRHRRDFEEHHGRHDHPESNQEYQPQEGDQEPLRHRFERLKTRNDFPAMTGDQNAKMETFLTRKETEGNNQLSEADQNEMNGIFTPEQTQHPAFHEMHGGGRGSQYGSANGNANGEAQWSGTVEHRENGGHNHMGANGEQQNQGININQNGAYTGIANEYVETATVVSYVNSYEYTYSTIIVG